jgi:acyl-CoA thioesterase
MTDEIITRSRFVAATGVRIEDKRAGYARMSVEIGAKHLGLDGYAHGGVLTSIMDSTLAVALRELRGEGATLHSSIEMNASFLGVAAAGETVTVEGRITDVQQAVAFGEVEARGAGGELVAKGRVTFAIQQAKA